jgi:predicted NBD/HSP70 family sugar kinase
VAAAVTAVLDPGLIVLAGGIGGNADLLAPPMRRALAKTVPQVPEVAPGQLGEDAVLAGAMATALESARNLVFDRRGAAPKGAPKEATGVNGKPKA